MGISAGHITFSVQSSRTASERLGRTHLAHYISYTLLSIFQQMASSFKMIYGLVHIRIQSLHTYQIFSYYTLLMHTGLTGIWYTRIMKTTPETQHTDQLLLVRLTLTE